MKRGFFLQGLLIMVMAFTVTAQVYLPKKTYMHLVGRIDVDQEITLNLVKVNDSLFADLVYTGKQCNYSVLSGKVDDEGTFLMKYPFCDTGMVFQGRFVTRQTLSGSYETVDGEISHPFVMVESYPEGSIPLLVYYHHFSRTLVDKPESPRAEISQCLIIPGESSNPVLSDSLRIRMISSFSGEANRQKDPDKAIQSIQQTFIKNYLSSNETLYETMSEDGSLNWTLLKFMHILYNDNNLLTYYVINYAYTGGAHGLETQDFTVVNTKTGEALSLEDIFLPGFETRLTTLLTKKLKEMTELQASEKLSDNGFFVDDVIPNSNFFITASGIGFFYNHYEIAPYANGPTDILLPFNELKEILRGSGPTAPFLNRH
ncbi:MAG: DUF3298 and DUF4163 domain-containing protein [Bacteroidia bacterium]|nr:DUF3298 and DUF4163 domain-containing protein [Bacteroidia bacterium]